MQEDSSKVTDSVISSEKSISDQTHYAGFLYRMLAFFSDSLVIFFFTNTILSVFGKGFSHQWVDLLYATNLTELNALNESYRLENIISLIFFLIYFITFHYIHKGSTPGKKLLGIKVVNEDGSDISLGKSIIRSFSLIVSFGLLFLGVFWIIWDKKKQSFHDKLAGTLVVKTGEKPKLVNAIILAILYILITIFNISLGLYKGFTLANSSKNAVSSSKELNDNLSSMSESAKSHYDKSNDLFKQMIEVSSTNASDVRDKVSALNDKNIAELKAALETDPENAELWRSLGDAYTWVSSDNTPESSLNAYKKAESLSPNNVLYINMVGDALIALNRNEEAILQFQKTLRLADDSGFAYLSLGTAYKNLGINKSAADSYEKAIEIFSGENDSGMYDDEILQAQKGLAEVSK